MTRSLKPITPPRLHLGKSVMLGGEQYLGLTGIADQEAIRSHRPGAIDALKDALAAILIAVCADLMRRLGALHARLGRVGKHTGAHLREFVAQLFAIPVFKLYYLLFQGAYALGQFRLRLLSRQSAALGAHDYSRQFDGLLPHKLGIAETEHRLRQIRARFERGQEG